MSIGQVFLVLKTIWGSSDSTYRCPDPPYFLKKFSNGVWTDQPIQDIPLKKLKVNMTDSIFDTYKKIEANGLRRDAQATQSRMVQTNKPPYVAPYVMNFSKIGNKRSVCRTVGSAKLTCSMTTKSAEVRVMRLNMSNTDPQQQEAASPQVLVVRSFLH